MKQEITQAMLRSFREAFYGEPAHTIAMNAVTANGVQQSAKRWDTRVKTNHQYSIRLKDQGITSQKSSGRCWMFAALNCMRYQLREKLNLEQFELSQNYTYFYDKLEKANYFLENILQTLDEPYSGRLLCHLLGNPMQDGGQWDMICAIVEKYGVVPKYAMPETSSSSDSRQMRNLLTEKLREDACILRNAYAAGKSMDELRTEKEKMLGTIYNMLCICLGAPPVTFDFAVRRRDGQLIQDRGLTPLEFYHKYFESLNNYVSLLHAPTEDKPLWRSYTVQYLGNVIEGNQIRYVNLPIEELKKAAIRQMQDGEPVWFGCDVGKHSNRQDGRMDLELYNYETLFDTAFTMTKEQRLLYGQSKMSHAMVFQGVDLDEAGQPVQWCVENSWGPDVGEHGMFLMTDAWFSEYMYQVVIHKKYLSEAIIRAYNLEPTALQPWDPMGSLA